MDRTTAITSAAGEHFVMYELLRRGFVAALPAANTPALDILVSDQEGSLTLALQVKTSGAPCKKWQMNKKHEGLVSPTLFYCFVSPRSRELDCPRCWIVPSEIVAQHVRESHSAWLNGIPKGNLTRNDSGKRSMHLSCEPLDKYGEGWMDGYLDAWHLLVAR